MPKTPKQLRQKAWDGSNPRYASLEHPEWEAMNRVPVHFWSDEQNHKRYLTWLGAKLGFQAPADWYAVTLADFLENRGHGFLEHYGNCYWQALQHHYPSYPWKPWLFGQAPNGYWASLDHCKAYVLWFEEQKGFRSPEDWYQITQQDLYELSGAGLMSRFDCSVQRLLKTVYPDFDWKPWLFVQVPKSFWPLPENRRAYLQWLGDRLGYRDTEDWYQLTNRHLVENCGGSLLQFGYRRIDLVRELFPDRQWLPWKFSQVAPGYWDQLENRLEYLRWLGAELGLTEAEDWLKITGQSFLDNYGGSVLDQCYHANVANAVQELFPERRWVAWEFKQVPGGFWDETANCRGYLDWLGERLGFQTMSDWYRVRRSDFREHCGNGFLKRFQTPYRGLRLAYPAYDWLPWMFENVPVGFWSEASNRTWYLRWVAEQLELRTPERWHQLSARELRSCRGNCLIAKYSLKEIREFGASLVATEDG